MANSEESPSTEAAGTNTAAGYWSRRMMLGRLGLLGVGGVAATSLLSGCDNGNGGGSASNGGGDHQLDNSVKGATDATKAANRKIADSLPFNERGDFDDAKRGLIARPDTLTIKNDKGDVVWDLEEYKKYIGDDKAAPDTVNPSLWRNAQLCMEYGLFEVVKDKIYQVRGYDLSNITFIKGDTGWLVYDTLISPETARRRSTWSTRSWARGRSSLCCTVIRTSTITAACVGSSIRPTSMPAR